MKTFLTITLLVISWQSFAQSAFHPVGKEGANLNYTFQADCELAEGQICYDVFKCPLDECTLVSQPDETTGIYNGKMLLLPSEQMIAAKQAKILAENQARLEETIKKKLACDDLKLVKKADLTSNAKTVDFLMKAVDCFK